MVNGVLDVVTSTNGAFRYGCGMSNPNAVPPHTAKGQPRQGGRQKGTPNKNSLKAWEFLEKEGVNPLLALANIVRDPAHPDHCRAAIELAQFCFPKLKPIDREPAETTTGGLSPLVVLPPGVDAQPEPIADQPEP